MKYLDEIIEKATLENEYVKISIKKYKKLVALYNMAEQDTNEQSRLYNQACAIESLLVDFGLTLKQIIEL